MLTLNAGFRQIQKTLISKESKQLPIHSNINSQSKSIKKKNQISHIMSTQKGLISTTKLIVCCFTSVSHKYSVYRKQAATNSQQHETLIKIKLTTTSNINKKSSLKETKFHISSMILHN